MLIKSRYKRVLSQHSTIRPPRHLRKSFSQIFKTNTLSLIRPEWKYLMNLAVAHSLLGIAKNSLHKVNMSPQVKYVEGVVDG